MQLTFYKYQGTGNDFILLDNRNGTISLSTEQINHLCDRRIGVGADGLMLLERVTDYDFKMVYYNADGNESTMCGNGGRCIVAFAFALGIIKNQTSFLAIDGGHIATLESPTYVNLQMIPVTAIEKSNEDFILNTGSPHYVQWIEDVTNIDVFHLGRAIRQQERFQPKGINVNFATQKSDDIITVRTYERGVEDETLSCGTGVTAVAIASTYGQEGIFKKTIETPGGVLSVSFEKDGPSSANNVWLSGPALMVYQGEITL
ncbi:MAG TPA: diaminopimelate epimerase [Flavipsychrobacter sp.]|jgi:diaminopimelate epimerase|nr:diaminopimelate epimerase [Flavipsychrobacter sp.]